MYVNFAATLSISNDEIQQRVESFTTDQIALISYIELRIRSTKEIGKKLSMSDVVIIVKVYPDVWFLSY